MTWSAVVIHFYLVIKIYFSSFQHLNFNVDEGIMILISFFFLWRKTDHLYTTCTTDLDGS